MADVREKVEQIRQAVYGKEVRESIASGIEAINTDIDALNDLVDALDSRVDTIITTPISGEAATQEIVDARVSAVKAKTFASLDARFEETEQDIATHMAEDVSQTGGVHGLEVEEGTWTPSSLNATFDVSYATYTKIGNLIKLQCEVNVTVKGTSFVIRGIPFVGVSKHSFGTYINNAEPLATQQTYYARIDSPGGGGRLGIFCSTASGAITTLTPSVGTFNIDIIYNID